MAASQVCSPRTLHCTIIPKACSSDDMFMCQNLHKKTHDRGSKFAYNFSKGIVGTCVNVTHHWDVMYTNLYNLQRGATAASPRRTHVNTNTHRHANRGGVDVDGSEKQEYSFFSLKLSQ